MFGVQLILAGACLVFLLLVFRFNRVWGNVRIWLRFEFPEMINHLKAGLNTLGEGDIVVIYDWQSKVNFHFRKALTLYDLIIVCVDGSNGQLQLEMKASEFGFQIAKRSIRTGFVANFVEVPSDKIESLGFLELLTFLGSPETSHFLLYEHQRLLTPKKVPTHIQENRKKCSPSRFEIEKLIFPTSAIRSGRANYDVILEERLNVFDPS